MAALNRAGRPPQKKYRKVCCEEIDTVAHENRNVAVVDLIAIGTGKTAQGLGHIAPSDRQMRVADHQAFGVRGGAGFKYLDDAASGLGAAPIKQTQ